MILCAVCRQPLAMLEPSGRKRGRWGLTLKGILGLSPSFLLLLPDSHEWTASSASGSFHNAHPVELQAEPWTEMGYRVEPVSQTKGFLLFIVCFRYVVPAWSADSHSCVAVTVLILRNLCSSSPAWFVNHNVTLLHTENRTMLSGRHQPRT